MAPSTTPNGWALFTHSLATAVADNNHVIYAGIGQAGVGLIVWKASSGEVVYHDPGDAEWGYPELEWRNSDGALLLSAASNDGKTIMLERVPGVSKATG